jgi:2-methylaconitate cis-trans-isomerase PrpF
MQATPAKLPAVFMRGGTSKAIIFHRRDLPTNRDDWAPLFLRAIGSPDPYGRQLNGMGGGVSSLSKVCVVGPPSRPDADVDYTFVQLLPRESIVDYSGNCGNMSSAIGPFAVDEGLVKAADGETTVRIHNTNTKKIICGTFRVGAGCAVVAGDLQIPGVAGTGSPIRLDFLDPGGASTGRLLPTGKPVDALSVPGFGRFEVSMVDAANACVFVNAASLGLSGTEMPEEFDANPRVLAILASIREHASVAMGVTKSLEEARTRALVPFVGMVSAPQDARTLTGGRIAAQDVDVTMRVIASGQPHRALPLTASLCTAVAAGIPETVVGRAPVRHRRPATPSDAFGGAQRRRGGRAQQRQLDCQARRLLSHGTPPVRGICLRLELISCPFAWDCHRENMS